MDENKQKICDLLTPVLQSTRAGQSLEKLEWDEKKECVFIHLRKGIRVANCECDSGLAMVKDIIKQFS